MDIAKKSPALFIPVRVGYASRNAASAAQLATSIRPISGRTDSGRRPRIPIARHCAGGITTNRTRSAGGASSRSTKSTSKLSSKGCSRNGRSARRGALARMFPPSSGSPWRFGRCVNSDEDRIRRRTVHYAADQHTPERHEYGTRAHHRSLEEIEAAAKQDEPMKKTSYLRSSAAINSCRPVQHRCVTLSVWPR